MSHDGQDRLRAQICEIVLQALHSKQVGLEQAAVACMGACATVLGVMPADTREAIAAMLEDSLLKHANQRAKEFRSGKFDRDIDRLLVGH